MSADTVLVTELTTTYSKGGMRYGPFKATAEKPYLEVPASIALASGAPVYDGEPIAAEQAELTDSVQLDEILKANHDLKDELDKVSDERDALKESLDTADEAGKHLQAERDTLQARVTELEAGNGQLLPAKDEAITRISSVKRVSDEMAAEIYTALTAPKSEAD